MWILRQSSILVAAEPGRASPSITNQSIIASVNKHLGRYINEFSGRYNDRSSDTVDQMVHMVQRMDEKRLPYQDLIERKCHE